MNSMNMNEVKMIMPVMMAMLFNESMGLRGQPPFQRFNMITTNDRKIVEVLP